MKQEEYLKIRNELLDKATALTISKSNDYTDDDIFDNFNLCTMVGVTRTQGIFIRLTDKFSRISNFIKNKAMKVTNESFEDNILDAINYLIHVYISWLDEKKNDK